MRNKYAIAIILLCLSFQLTIKNVYAIQDSYLSLSPDKALYIDSETDSTQLKADPDGIPAGPNRLYRILDYYDSGTFRLSGRIYYDFAALNKKTEDTQQVEYGSRARSFRLRADGLLRNSLRWRAELEIVSNTFTFRGAYIYHTWNNSHLMFGNIIKEPMGIERMSPLGWYPFIELPPASGAFMPDRNLTLRYEHRGKRYNLMASIHNGADRITDSSLRSGYAFTGRATFAPHVDKHSFIHVGLNGSYRVNSFSEPDSLNGAKSYQPIRFSVNPGSRAEGSAFFGREPITKGKSHSRIVLDAATGFHAFYIQGEWTQIEVFRANMLNNISLYGYYLQAGIFLTGESRPYRPTHGNFGPLTPKNDFNFGRGTGAIELAFRYSHNNYDDPSYAGGLLNHYSAALNWYISRDTRLMFNVLHYTTHRLNENHVKELVFASRLNVEF